MISLADHYKCQKCGEQVPTGLLCLNCLQKAVVNKNEKKEEEGMNQKTEPNDMAFPAAYGDIDGGNVYQGMTKREYFSIMILQGMLAGGLRISNAAPNSIVVADELIKELNK